MLKKIIKCLLVIMLCITLLPVNDTYAKEDYRTWAQSDPRWGSLKLGKSSKTCSKVGCLVTSITKTMIQASLKDQDEFDPGVFIKWLNKNNGFQEASFDWSKAEKYIPEFKNCGRLMTYGKYSSKNNNKKLINWIKDGYHLLLNVDSGGHWIAVDEKKTLETGTVYIMDSLKSSPNADVKLSSRYSTFNQVHAYKGGTLLDEEPEISDLNYVVDKDTCTITCKVSDDYGVTKAVVETWSSLNDKDDVKSETVEVKSNAITYKVKTADHHNELGEYQSQITVLDKKGNTATKTIKYVFEKYHNMIRIFGDDRYQTAYKSADELKSSLGVEQFDAIIVASGENFADALAGSYLSAKKNAPIIMGSQYDYLMKDTQAYIKNNLKEKGTVYILGGVAAIPASFEEGLSNYEVKRLAGDNRYETNLAILNEAGITDEDILVCTGNNFADSLSASATGLPILLLNNGINDKQKEFLENLSHNNMTIVGGTKAIAEAVEEELKAYGEVSRIAGESRYETSTMVAERYFSNPTSAILAYAKNFPDGLSGGPLAYATKAPLILTDNETSCYTITKDYMSKNNIKNGYVLGGTILVQDNTLNEIFN